MVKKENGDIIELGGFKCKLTFKAAVLRHVKKVLNINLVVRGNMKQT